MPCEEKSFWTKTFDNLSGYIHTYLDAFDLETQLFGDSHGGFLARKLPEEGNGRKISDVSFKLFEEFFYDRLWNKGPVDEYADVIKNALEDLDCRNIRLDKLRKLVMVRFETIIHQHPTPFPWKLHPKPNHLLLHCYCLKTVKMTKCHSTSPIWKRKHLTIMQPHLIWRCFHYRFWKSWNRQHSGRGKFKKDQKSSDKEKQLEFAYTWQ